MRAEQPAERLPDDEAALGMALAEPLQLGAARNWRRALIARAATARDQAIAAGDLDAARQQAVQGLVVTAAQKSADQAPAPD